MEFRKQIEMMFREKQSTAPSAAQGMGGAGSSGGRSRLPVNHFVCNFEGCGATIKHRRNLVRHWQLHQKAKYFCARCGQLFTSRELITQHDCDRNEQRFHCDQCEKRFSALQHLNRHLLLMHGQRLFVWCPTCRSYFARIDALKKHQSRCHSLSAGGGGLTGLAGPGGSAGGHGIAGFELNGNRFAELSGQAAAAAAAAAAVVGAAGPSGSIAGGSQIGSLGQSVITSAAMGHGGSSMASSSATVASVTVGGRSVSSNANNFSLGSNDLLNMVKNVDCVRNALMGAAAAGPSGSMGTMDYTQGNLFSNLICDGKMMKPGQMFSFANLDSDEGRNGSGLTASGSGLGSGNSSGGTFCPSNLLLSNYGKLSNENARTKKTKMDLVRNFIF